jgi:hypothetical protein
LRLQVKTSASSPQSQTCANFHSTESQQ